MTNSSLLPRLKATQGIMFDIDGCLVISDGPSGAGGSVLPGAIESIKLAQDTGRAYCVFTNGTAQRPKEIAHHLRDMGFDIPDELVFTPAVVAAEVMKEKYGDQPILVFAAEGMLEDFRERGVNLVDVPAAIKGAKHNAVAVVIGWDTNFGKDKIQLAAEAIRDGAELYCTSYAPMFASADRLNVGVSGFITSGLMFVTGKKDFEILGKPSQHSMNVVSRVLGTAQENILVIGDDIKLESTMARNAGALAGLVLTGTSSREDAENADPAVQPELIVESMTELVDLFTQADNS
jgi:HAD superfamily hydrolase (TIGR01450 family)